MKLISRMLVFSGLMSFAVHGNAMGRRDPNATKAGSSQANIPSATGSATSKAPAAGGIVPVGGISSAQSGAATTGAGNPIGIGNSGTGMSQAGMGTAGASGTSGH